jgi:dissimilatory sulfite reductase related protein
MAIKKIFGKDVNVTDDGYMTDATQWTKEMAVEIAREEGIALTDKHYKILNFLREKHLKGEILTIRSVGKSGIVDIKGFYELFPGGPLKKASKIAGIPKPVSCV